MSTQPHLNVVVTEVIAAASEAGGGEEYSNFSSVAGQSLITWSWEVTTWSWYVVCELLIAILGIIGNVIVIAVVFGRRSKSRSTDIFVGNLAIADFLTSILLIPYPKVKSIPNTWTGELYCKVMEDTYLLWTTVTASIYSLVVVSLDRFFAVVYPIHFKRFANRRLVNCIVCLIWVGSSILMIRILLTNTTSVVIGKCAYRRPPRNQQIVYGIYVFVIRLALPTVLMLVTQTAIARSLRREAARFASNESTASFHQIARSRVLTLTLTFALPAVLMLVTQIAIVRSLRREATRFESNESTASFHQTARSRVLTLTFAVVLIYFICWSPDQIAYFSFNLGLTPSFVRSPFARVVTALAICNSCVNPILYTLRHPQFREAVTDFFRNTSKENTPIFEDL
ncbi:cholecystokinin receptor-like [Diadema antillarum]|uniref:cholecystokinin receptor-like n=1 Tax=Diadema antillarum TaxID=105358 RepID=UPI003A8578A5